MNKGSIALGAVATVVAVGYLVVTEYPVWKQFSGDGDRQAGSGEESGQGGGEVRDRAPEPPGDGPGKAGDGSEATASAAGGSDTRTGKAGRQGTTVYWVDKRCDCPQNYALMLEAVTIDDKTTTLTLLNARRNGQSTYAPGHKDALFLLESRLVNNDRPRHDLLATRGIGHYPEGSTELVMELVFPRIHDEAETIRLIGNSTVNLMTLDFTGIQLNNPMPLDAWKRFQAYKKCGFDGPATIPAGQSVTFQAHAHAGASDHAWSGKQLEVTDDRQSATVRGETPGEAELCLTSKVGGASCTSCQPLEVIAAAGPAPVPDFRLESCAGFPSRQPGWRFAVSAPDPGTTYAWSVTGHAKIVRESGKKNPVIVKPTLRPGEFTVALEATDRAGRKASLSRTMHNVYSCPE